MVHPGEISRDLIDAFAVLEVSEKQVRLYLRVLQNGEVPLHEEVASEDAILTLKQLGLVYAEPSSEGEEFIRAIDPIVAINALYSRRLWRYTPDETWSGNNKYLQITKEYYHAKDYLIRELERKYVSTEQKIRGTAHIPEATASSALSVSIRQAEEEILGITTPHWLPHVSLIWEAIKNRLQVGVVYRRLCDETTIMAFGHRINERDIFEVGVNLRVLPLEVFKEKYFIIDDKEAFIFSPGDPDAGFKLEATKISLKPLVKVYKDKYLVLWKQGVSAKDVIQYVGSLKDAYIAKCLNGHSDKARSTIEGLFDYGKFYKREYNVLDEKELVFLLSDLFSKGYLVEYSDSEFGYLPNIVPQIREYVINKQTPVDQ